MESEYHREGFSFKSIDYDALFSAFCLFIIVLILGLTDGDCDAPLREWLTVKGTVLILRLAIKSGFFIHNEDSWFKIVMLVIKLFGIAWIITGIVWVWNEQTCYNDWSSLYVAVLWFIAMFIAGFIVFIAGFFVACVIIRRTRQASQNLTLNQ